jgi:glycosyltransferase involved in cell wall biosynthesis
VNPLVSVCIPAFEQPEPLARALESALAQDYVPFEIIVTDDSRDDRVEKTMARFSRDPRIAYARNRPSKGSPGNWNEAIRRSRGAYVKMLHHDDWFTDAGSLSAFVAAARERPGCRLAFSAARVCDPSGKEKRVHAPSQALVREIIRDPRVLIWANWIGGPSSTIFPRSADAFFDPRLQWLVDVDLYLSLLAGNSAVAYTARPLVATTDGSALQVTYSLASKKLRISEWLVLYKKWNPRVTVGCYRYFMDLLVHADPAMVGSLLARDYPTFPALLKCALLHHRVRYHARAFRRKILRRPR